MKEGKEGKEKEVPARIMKEDGLCFLRVTSAPERLGSQGQATGLKIDVH